MKKNFTLTLITAFVFSQIYAQSQNTFKLHVQNMLLARVVNTSFDSGYLVAGHNYYFGLGYDDIQLVKLNKHGDTLWTKVYGTAGSDDLSSIISTSDHGFLITASHGWLAEILKLDSLGNLLWSKMTTLYSSKNNYNTVVAECANGSYLFGFQSDTNDGIGTINNVIVKLDKKGHEKWHKVLHYWPVHIQLLHSIMEHKDKSIYTLSQEYTDELYSSLILNKYDRSGNPVWNRVITPAKGRGAYGDFLLQTKKGHILIVGSLRVKSGLNKYTVIRMDTTGKILSADTMTSNEIVLAKYLRQLKDAPVSFDLDGTYPSDMYLNLCLAADGGIIISDNSYGNVTKTDSAGRVCPDFAEGLALAYNKFPFTATSYPLIFNIDQTVDLPDSVFKQTSGATITEICSSAHEKTFPSFAVNHKNPARIALFPNPVKNTFTITGLDEKAPSSIMIVDMKGSIITSFTARGSSYTGNIQISAGTYILKIKNGTNMVSLLFVKQ